MIYNNLKILGSVWLDRFGIVKAKDTISNEIKFYMGVGLGLNEKEDIEYIVSCGAKYTPESLRSFIDWLRGDDEGN